MAPKGKGKRKEGKKENGEPEPDPKREMLLREMKLAVMNTERYRRYWRETLLRMKRPDIVRNVQIAWRTMERSFDLKDYSISLLLDGLQEIEDQSRRANRARAETFDRSLRTHEHRLKEVDAVFHRNIDEMLTEKNCQIKNIDNSRDTMEGILYKVTWCVNRRDGDALNMAKSIAIGKIDNFTDNGQNERRLIGAQLEKRVEDLWDELRNIFADYRKNTADRRKAYETIRKKDEFDRQEVSNQWQRIATILDEITKFREKIYSYKIGAAIELQDITEQSDLFHATYREKNKRFVQDRQEDKRKATIMSKEYNFTLKTFQKLIDKAERVLVYLQICRKYETQDEKIIQTINNYDLSESQSITMQQSKGLPLQQAVHDYDCSINFWRRLGLAQLIALELRAERDRLFTQTNNLRESIARYLVDKTSTISAC